MLFKLLTNPVSQIFSQPKILTSSLLLLGFSLSSSASANLSAGDIKASQLQAAAKANDVAESVSDQKQQKLLKPIKAGVKPDRASYLLQEKSQEKGQLILMAKLEQLSFFSADFTQTISDIDGQVLQQGKGTITVSKPNLINWTTLEPDESQIVSDGDSLWLYDPFVEQVSAFTLKQAIANTPILLITSNDDSLWQDYQVRQLSEQQFAIDSKASDAQVKSLTLTFNQTLLSVITITDATGQVSQIELSNIDNENMPDLAQFRFKIPDGVDLDDQR